MGPAEALFRVRRQGEAWVNRFGIGLANDPPLPSAPAQEYEPVLGRTFADHESYIRHADRILEGKLRIFALDPADIGHPPEWNRDPLTGRVAPLAFGKTLNYRDAATVGDIKYLWEVNRHLQLVPLAQAYRITGNTRYLEGLRLQLTSWLKQCPYPRGVHWTSSLEVAIRLINWAIVWDLLDGWHGPLFQSDDGEALRRTWLRSIYQHAHFIRTHLSAYSSANNHLLGELSGLIVAGCAWPVWPELIRWRNEAISHFCREYLLQNAPDGSNREQAIWYQQFVMDFAVYPVVWMSAAGIEVSKGLLDRLEAGMCFLASLMNVGGSLPMMGDADDGLVATLCPPEDFDPFRSMLALGAVWFSRADLKTKAGHLDDRVRQLAGPDAESRWNELPHETFRPQTSFPDAGVYIMGDRLEEQGEVRVITDAGPLGYLSLAAHGHADALSFTLALDGHPILIDPGTYAYHTHPFWRSYFRGTAAHNTIRVDGHDQAVQGGSFMWSKPMPVSCDEWVSDPGEDLLVATHRGYQRLDDPVTHTRQFRLAKGQGFLAIDDHLDCRSKHQIERFWHFAPECDVRQAGSRILIEREGSRVTLELSAPPDQLEILQGDEERPAGWQSPSFDVKMPAITVIEHAGTEGTRTLTAVLRWH